MDFPIVCAKSVVTALAQLFNVDMILKDPPKLSAEEVKWKDRLALMIRCAESGEMRLHERSELVREDYQDNETEDDWDYEEEDNVTNTVTFTKEMFDHALTYYRSAKRKRNRDGQGVRSLDGMSKRFRWITSQSILDKIVQYERTGNIPRNRNQQLEKLALALEEEVDLVISEGRQFTDFELREMALSLNRNNLFWEKFQASKYWLHKWKRRFRVCSRRITEFVSLKTERDSEKTLELVEKVRKEVKDIVANNPGIEIWNCDQTGLVKENHSNRTLARKGAKKVKALVQSKNATSHSITLLPIIGSDGFQHQKLFVQLGEPSGHLPVTKGCYTEPSLEIAVGKSHIMGRDSAAKFFKNVLFDGNVPPTLLLLLDSWPIFKDHAFIRSFAPSNVKLFIVNIPPGGTSICQPADLSFNHQIKGIQKKLTTLVMFRDIPYRISQRDNLLKFAAQTHWVLASDCFKAFIAYGFYKGGFVAVKPPYFEGPKQKLFGAGSHSPCSCSKEGFSQCPRCDQSFCFHCFWEQCHRC